MSRTGVWTELMRTISRSLGDDGPIWCVDDKVSPLTLAEMLMMTRSEMSSALNAPMTTRSSIGAQLAPIEDSQEVWACGVTYLRSRDERRAESTVADVYSRVYEAERPELFFKAIGWRVVFGNQRIRVRRDSLWNVPEPELTLVINRHAEIIGYTAGNDVSSRSIEGENPLYLPQAKCYDGACSLGGAIVLAEPWELENLPISCKILRGGNMIYGAESSTAQMKRKPAELVSYLFREMSFPTGVFLMTGTPIVPERSFSLLPFDKVGIQVGEVVLFNEVDSHSI